MTATNAFATSLAVQDLRAFALPGSDFQIDDRGNFTFQCRTKLMVGQLLFSPENTSPDVLYLNQRLSFRSFLALEEMADLSLIARQTLAVLPGLDSYIQTFGSISDGEPTEPSPCDSLLLDLCSTAGEEATRLIFVRAAAGAGKTECVRMLARQQALRYLSGESDWIFFYVDAQGKSLSSLTDVFASQVHKYGIYSIRNDSMAALTRGRLLVPIIDGFDELVGSGGHEESFGALAIFLAQLYGSGCIVATGRSTYYENQKLRTAAQRFNFNGTINYTFHSIMTYPWTDEQIERYGQISGSSQRAREQVQSVFRTVDAGSTLRSPFFVSKALMLEEARALTRADENRLTTDSLLDVLVESLLLREVSKLATEDGAPILSIEGHRYMLRLCAQEAWALESEILDAETLDLIADYTATEFGLNPKVRGILGRRLPMHAFLAGAGGSHGASRFEHALYFEFFLADVFCGMIRARDSALPEMLRHSLLSPDFTPQFSAQRQGWEAASIKEAVGFVLSSVSAKSFGGQAARKNGGILVAELARVDSAGEGFDVTGVDFMQIDFSQTQFNQISFKDCLFCFCSFANASWSQCSFQSCYWEMADVSNRTRMIDCSFAPPEYVSSLRWEGEEIYDPTQIFQQMSAMGFLGFPARKSAESIGWTPRQTRIVELLRRFLKRMERTFQIDISNVESVEPSMRRIMENDDWSTLRGLLMTAGLLEPRHAQRSGQDQRLWRLASPIGSILAGEKQNSANIDTRISTFWESIRELE